MMLHHRFLTRFAMTRFTTFIILMVVMAGTTNVNASVIIYGSNNFSPSGVLRVDSSTTHTFIASGGNIVNPADIEIFGSNSLLVSSVNGHGNLNDINGDGALVRVDRTTGAQTLISNNSISSAAGGATAFAEPAGMDFDAAGNIIVADPLTNSLIRVDPTTGAQTVISSGGSFGDPRGVAVESSGNYLVSDPVANSVFRVTPGGAQSTLTSGGFLDDPFDLVLGGAGTAYVSDPFDAQIIAINQSTGVQTVLSSGGNLTTPLGLEFANGFLYVAQNDTILRIDPTTGAQFVEWTGLGNHVQSVAVTPEPSTLVLAAFGFAAFAAWGWRRKR